MIPSELLPIKPAWFGEQEKGEVKMKRIYRSSKEHVIAGVCGGMGEYFDQDPVLFRIIFVLVTLLFGFGILAYLVFWISIPKDTKKITH
jgi:phage shock protein C